MHERNTLVVIATCYLPPILTVHSYIYMHTCTIIAIRVSTIYPLHTKSCSSINIPMYSHITLYAGIATLYHQLHTGVILIYSYIPCLTRGCLVESYRRGSKSQIQLQPTSYVYS